MSEKSSGTVEIRISKSGLTHAATAAVALLVGGVCGYGFSPFPQQTARASSIPTASRVEFASQVETAVPMAAQIVAPVEAQKATVAVAQPAIATVNPSNTVSATTNYAVTYPQTNNVVTDRGVTKWELAERKTVGNVELVLCHLERGWPMIAIRSMDEEKFWYVQKAPVPGTPKQFECEMVFGNTNTPAGTRFQVALIVLNDLADASQYTTGSVLRELPTNREVAAMVNVARE